jgi:hypothetical protein
VPKISSFYGVVIAMYFYDHRPPHFHARYGEFDAQVEISTGDILRGELPGRALVLVREWAALHREELDANWMRAVAGQALVTIEPLP